MKRSKNGRVRNLRECLVPFEKGKKAGLREVNKCFNLCYRKGETFSLGNAD